MEVHVIIGGHRRAQCWASWGVVCMCSCREGSLLFFSSDPGRVFLLGGQG